MPGLNSVLVIQNRNINDQVSVHDGKLILINCLTLSDTVG